MSKKIKFLGLFFLVFVLVVGIGASSANATLTLGALTVDSSGALNLGTSTATSLSVGATGVTTTNNGALTVTQNLTAPVLIGGSTTTSSLTLRSTSGVGTTGADIIFQAGNNGATEAMRILNSGNVGINTTTPLAKFSVVDGAVLASGTTGATPTSGAGTRMMWIPAKGAFRAGVVDGTQWDNANIGSSSFVLGNNSKASGANAIALGLNAEASGDNTLAFGNSTVASDSGAVAIGYGLTASAANTFAFGTILAVPTIYEAAFGNYNVIGSAGGSWTLTDPLFVIGNGTAESSPPFTVTRQNAFTLLKNGDVYLGGMQSDLVGTGALLKLTSTEATFSSPATFSSAKNKGTVALVGGTKTVTVLAGAVCTATDTTAVAPVRAVVSGTTLTLTGTGTDVIAYLCF